MAIRAQISGLWRSVLALGVALAFGLAGCVLTLFLGRDRMWLVIGHNFGRTIVKILGITLEVQGRPLSSGPAIFIANHQSLLDVLILPAVLPRTTRFIAKKSLALVPLWGWAFALGGALLVDRARTARAKAALARGLRRLPVGWSLMIFPEGTRSRTGVLQPLRKGAFHLAQQCQLPLIPIGIGGARQLMPLGVYFSQPGTIVLTVGEPLPAPPAAVAGEAPDFAPLQAAALVALARCQQASEARLAARGNAAAVAGTRAGIGAEVEFSNTSATT